jgi:hypothetical protein
MQALSRARDTRIISRVPNVLTLIALLWRQFSWLPSGRTELYARITEAYSISIPRLRRLDVDYTQGEKQVWLQMIAWELQKRRAQSSMWGGSDREYGDGGEVIDGEAPVSDDFPLDEMKLTRDEVRDLLKAELARCCNPSEAALEASLRETLYGFLRFVTHTSGLLCERTEGMYGFTHLSFQEYYAAAHARSLFFRALTDSVRMRKSTIYEFSDLKRDLAPLTHSVSWRETGVFLGEMLSVDTMLEHPVLLLEAVMPEVLEAQPANVLADAQKVPDPVLFPAASLVACLTRNPRVAIPDAVRQQIWRRLWQWHFWSTHRDRKKSRISLASSLLEASPYQSEIVASLVSSARSVSGGLKDLSLQHCIHLDSVDCLPNSLVSLDVVWCKALHSLDNLPESLKFLNAGGCARVTSVDWLPAGLLTLLLLVFEGLENVDHLPTSLHMLIVAGCDRLKAIDHLPKSMGTLFLISCKALTRVDHLPDSMTTLALHSCNGITSIDHLPDRLLFLNLESCLGLQTIDHLPRSLRSLRIKDCAGISPEAVARVRRRLPSCEVNVS